MGVQNGCRTKKWVSINMREHYSMCMEDLMKKCVLTGIRGMELIDVEPPAVVRDDQVLIRMGAVGVCGSDIHYYLDGKIGSQVVEYPFAVGHEGAGTVEAVGRAVRRVEPGDRVAVEPAMPCGHCDQCRSGRPHTCRRLKFLGCPKQAEGCLAELVVMPEESCFPIPESMTLAQAALSEPLAIGVYAVEQSIPMRGAKIGILGAGPIGISVLIPARLQGAERIYMTDKIDGRLSGALRHGADWVGNPDTIDVVRDIVSAEPEMLDAVFECCGDQAALDQAVQLLKPGGRLMIVGIPPNARVSFPIDILRHRELTIVNVRRQNGCVQKTLDLIAGGKAKVDDMITHRFRFTQTKEAFDLVAEYRDGVIKAMIEF
jgi:L-iditol 2-dehydrogenase